MNKEDDKLKCDQCDDTGFILGPAVRDRWGTEQPSVTRCACRGAVYTEDGLLRSLRIPPRYVHCNIKDFETQHSKDSRPRVEALRKVAAYCRRYGELSNDSHERGLGLLFTGTNGTGKTFLAVATLRELVEQHGVSGQFWDFHELLREIKNSYDPSTQLTEYDVLEPVIEAEVLLLDDLGAWRMTDWMNDTLFHILNQRYLERRPTLITTNYPESGKEESPVRHDPLNPEVRERLIDRVGPRLRSRLLEMCGIIRLLGDDRRQGQQGAIEHKLT